MKWVFYLLVLALLFTRPLTGLTFIALWLALPDQPSGCARASTMTRWMKCSLATTDLHITKG